MLAKELLDDLEGDIEKVREVVVAAGTGGTILGVAERFNRVAPHAQIVGVDEPGSKALRPKEKPLKRYLTGMGTRDPSPNYEGRRDSIHQIVYVKADEAIDMAVRVARSEGILAGGSSGAVLKVMKDLADSGKPDEIVVGILADQGSRYVDTIFNADYLDRCTPLLTVLQQEEAQRWSYSIEGTEDELIRVERTRVSRKIR